MTLPKLLAFTALILFSVIGIAAYFKNGNDDSKQVIAYHSNSPIEVDIDSDQNSITTIQPALPAVIESPKEIHIVAAASEISPKSGETPPEADRIDELFNINGPKLPIVETISYKSKTAWMKGRPAWLSDYAGHFKTSRHFIARSWNGKPDYLKQDIPEGAKFNILKPEKNIHFNLVVDTSRCKMWFYYHDLDTNDKVLIKTYKVGLGRIDPSKVSGILTPLGVYSLGSRIAVYKAKDVANHNGTKTEMIRVFGTRWIPFEKEISKVTAPAKGFGIHGAPWVMKNGALKEDIESISKYESDGCVRMSKDDIEELYAIIITRPTTIELVKDYFDAENRILSDEVLHVFWHPYSPY
jgi:hypothetical protein